ncbi:MAG: phosphoesterase [Bryobacterales bacterium]|nr:phosphoesterase [Bryobacterales bacterium]
MRVKILHHDRCFDGACSAALFSSFVRRSLAPGAELSYGGLYHRADQLFDESDFDGDINVIVDFKYSSSEKVTWWFDHHQSAFLSAADAEHFRRDRSGRKFFDPAYKSCAKFIANTLAAKFGFDSRHLADLIHWADVLDGARHPSAKAAVEMKEPALKLNLIIESAEINMTPGVIPLLEAEPLEAIVDRPAYKQEFRKLYERHERTIETISKRAVCNAGVVFFDLVGTGLKGYNKFIPYFLYPQSAYTVSLLDGGFRAKVSVGSNPWSAVDPTHNLAELCERYGGGGHPRVGAISFSPEQFSAARAAALEIAEILSDR